MNFSDFIVANKTNLATNYSKLGKTTGSGFWHRRKILLSFDKTNGWRIVKLNPLQMFFRQVFGAYKNTHLKSVFKQVAQEKVKDKNIPLPLYQRLSQLWSKKFVVAVGNSSPAKADVFCFGEKHGDVSYRAVAVQFINDHYRKGDIVLVEGIKAGKVISPKDHQMVRGLKEECIVQGWEPENFEELNGAAFSDHKAKCKQLKDLYKSFKQEVPTGRPLTSQELDLIEKKVKTILDQVSQLNKYYQSKSPGILNAPAIFANIMKKARNDEDKDPGPLLLYAMLKILRELEKCQEKALYKNMKTKDTRLVLKNGPIRDKSLIEEINKYRSMGKRVFVVAGMSHILQMPRHGNNLPVRECLQKHRFVVMGRKTKIEDISYLNPGLFTQKLRG